MTEKSRFDIEVGDTSPINGDSIDFEEIQAIFSNKSRYYTNETGLIYRPVELKNKPKYDNMRVKNLTISEKIVEQITGFIVKGLKKGEEIQEKFDSNIKLKVVTAAVIATSVIITIGATSNNTKKSEMPFNDTKLPSVIQKESNSGAINPIEQDYSNLSVILKTSTPNTIQVTSTASRELTNFGIDNQRVTTETGMIEAVKEIKTNNPNAEIIVINVDGRSDTRESDVIVITNTDISGVKSADNLAIAIRDNNNRQYGINTYIKCGESKTNGERVETEEQAALIKAGCRDVLCCNIKTSSDQIADEIVSNSIATSIAEGIARLGATEAEKRYVDSIIISKSGDEIVPVAEANGMTHSAFVQSNMDIIENGIIKPNEAMVITTLPYTLNVKDTQVLNNLTTTNSNIDFYTKYYTVQSGQTITQIADNIGVAIDDIYVPSGDKNRIRTGENIGYTVPDKIIVKESKITKGQK